MIDAAPSVAPATTHDKKKFTGTYSEYLESPHWLTVKARKLNQSNRLCEACRTDQRLEVHHLNYNSIGNEALFELMVLCHDCHEFSHKLWAHQPSHLPAKSIQKITLFFLSNHSKNKRVSRKRKPKVILPHLTETELQFMQSSISSYLAKQSFKECKPTPNGEKPKLHKVSQPKIRKTKCSLNRIVLKEPSYTKWTSKLTTRFK